MITIANKGGGPRKPYNENDDERCDHDYDEDENAGEFVCIHCGDRVPMDPLTDLIK